jgi:hypothetical protein
MSLIVVGTSPTTGEVLVKDTETGDMEWQKGTEDQIARNTKTFFDAGDSTDDIDYETYTPAKKKKVTDENQELLDQIAEMQAQIDKLLKNQKTTTGTGTGAETGIDLTGGDASGVPWYEELPVAAWSKAFDIPAMGTTPVQDWLSRQAAPSYASYMANSYLNPQENPMDWAGYISGQGWKGAQSSAKNLFSQALGDPNGQGSFVDIMGDYLDSFMKNVLGNFYAAPVASKLASKVGALQNEYQGNTQGSGTSFLDYLKQKYNLGGMFGSTNTGESAMKDLLNTSYPLSENAIGMARNAA